MPVRPAIEEETVERINEALESRMTVSPESVSIDERIKVVLDEWAADRQDLRVERSRSENQVQGLR